MKRSCVTIVFAFVIGSCFAQLNPVHWEFNYKKITSKTGELHLIAIIENSWHLYSQLQPIDAVATPTKIKFSSNPIVALQGKAKEIGKKEIYQNKEIGVTQYHYENRVDFVQNVSLKVNMKTNLSGTIRFQVCNEEQCLPVKTVAFSIKIE